MRIADLIALSKKYNLTLQVNPEDPYIIVIREIQIGRHTWRLKRYISWADFEMLEDCLKYLIDDINSEEVAFINEHGRI